MTEDDEEKPMMFDEALARLRAGLERDEDVAIEAQQEYIGAPWEVWTTESGDVGVDEVGHGNSAHPVESVCDVQVGEHVARQGPARVLRQVEAMRKVIATHRRAELWYEKRGESGEHVDRTEPAKARLDALAQVIEYLAEVYSDAAAGENDPIMTAEELPVARAQSKRDAEQVQEETDAMEQLIQAAALHSRASTFHPDDLEAVEEYMLSRTAVIEAARRVVRATESEDDD